MWLVAFPWQAFSGLYPPTQNYKVLSRLRESKDRMLYKITDVHVQTTKLLFKLMRLWCHVYSWHFVLYCFRSALLWFSLMTIVRVTWQWWILHVYVVSRTLCNKSQGSGNFCSVYPGSRSFFLARCEPRSRCYDFLTSVAERTGFNYWTKCTTKRDENLPRLLNIPPLSYYPARPYW